MQENESIHGIFMQSRKIYSARKREMFAQHNLSPGQPRLLKFIKQNEGCSQKELADKCMIEQATATSILTTLERQGLITRQSCQNDKRRMRLFLTALGQEKAEIVTQIFEELDQLSVQGFTDEEHVQLINYLTRIFDNLSQDV